MKTISPQKIVDYLDRRCDGQTRSMVEEWMARSEENRDEFFRIKQLWALKNTYKHASAPEVEGAVRRINQQLDQRRRIRRLQYLARTAVAAALLFGAVLAGIGVDKYRERFEWHTIANTVPGEVLDFVLDDGTRVYLNRGGELSFREDFGARRRRVKLSGEAFFDVKSDPVHPFVVETRGVHIRVLGTSFNVKAGERIEATLEKGRIALESASGEELATLRPGQQAVVDVRSRRLLSVSEVQTGKYTAWHYNHKVYECISFSEIVGLIEERYDVSVIYDPSSFDDTAYRLVVGNNEPLGQMLDILNLIVPIEYTVQDRRVLIKRKR